VVSFDPEHNTVTTKHGKYEYQYLIVAAGLETKWDAIKGLQEALDDEDSGVGSNYSYRHLDKMAYLIYSQTNLDPNFRAVFTQPPMPIKCAGAPQKVMYIAEDYWRQWDCKSEVEFYTAMPVLFGQPDYAQALNEICDSRDISRFYHHDLIEVRKDRKEAIFVKTAGEKKEEVCVKYDVMHVTPKQGPHAFIKDSPLADKTGFVDVDKFTLQHVKYPNVFSLGDASNLPTSKTAAAISAQQPVVAGNILSRISGREIREKYDGYTSCPLVVGWNTLIFAEFAGPGYGNHRMETFPFLSQTKPSRLLYYLKKDWMPLIYWQGLLKGRWGGPSTLPFPWTKRPPSPTSTSTASAPSVTPSVAPATK